MAKSQHAHFSCQKCGQPLVLDTSFANLKVEDEAYNELAGEPRILCFRDQHFEQSFSVGYFI